MSEIAAEIVSSGATAEAPQSTDNVGNFSFSGLHEKALAMFEGGAGTPGDSNVTEQPATSTATPAETPTQNVDNATPAQLASIKPTDLVEVTVDGQKVQMPWAEAEKGVMRQAHYTKSMQDLARQRQEIEASRPQIESAVKERDALVAVLKDENLLRTLLEQKYPHLLAQAKEAAVAQVTGANGIEPDDIATVGQIQEVAQAFQANVAEQVKAIQSNLSKEVERATQAIEDRQATFKLASEINTTIDSLKAEHPYMEKVVPNFNEVLRYNVAQMAPRTPAETLEAFKTVFGGMVENFKAAVAETTKSSVIQKQELLKNNIQPPGGAAVTPQPTSFKKTNPMTGKTELDWSKLTEAGLAMLK